MSVTKSTPIRFGLLTALVWLAVAAGSILLLWYVIKRISASNLPITNATPNQTQVFQTVAAIVNSQTTNSAINTPQTDTPSPTSRATVTPATAIPSPNKTNTPGGGIQTITQTGRCDQAGAGNPLDITIPDDSLIQAGEGFIKTWKLVNIGTCIWTTSYSASFFYGDRMGAPESVPFEISVLPAQSVEISIEMIAPISPGSYQGNWKLSNPSGELFGIGPNSDLPFWVRIIVPENPARTATATPGVSPTQGVTATNNPTISPSPTSTPPILASRVLSPAPGDTIDLDTLRLNSGDETLAYQVDEHGYHWLSPKNQALIGVYGNVEPSFTNCQSAVMSPAPIAVESLPVGTYLCYTTNESHLGRAFLEAVDPHNFTLALNLLTWALP